MTDSNEGVSVALGDFLQRLSTKLNEELKILLDSFPSQSPELRTEKLRKYISRSKKRLAQCYAICSWLKEDHVRLYLQSSSDLIADVEMKNFILNQYQDGLYFSHASLYSKRTRPPEILLAKDIIARETYANLPEAIFTSGLKNTSNLIDINILKRSLCNSIACKLLLNDISLHFADSVEIEDGLLKITKQYQYELTMTLTHANENAAWIVQSFHLLVDSHPAETFEGTFARDSIEQGTLKSLQKYTDKNESFATEIEKITQIHRICYYSSLSASIRLLYMQGTEVARTSWAGISESLFMEEVNVNTFHFNFWRKRNIDSYQIQLAVSLVRKPLGQTLSFQIRQMLDGSTTTSTTTTTSTKSTMNDHYQIIPLYDTTLSSPYSSSEEDLLRYVIDSGISFGRLLQVVLAGICRHRLKALYESLLSNSLLEKLTAEGGLRVTYPSNQLLHVDISCGDAHLFIGINAATGKFTSFMENIVEGISREVVDSFLLELNDTFEETTSTTPTTGSWSGSASTASHPTYSCSNIVTLEAVIQQLLLLWWASRLHSLCNLVALSKWSSAILMSAGIPGAGLVFNMLSWRETTSTSPSPPGSSPYCSSYSSAYDIAVFIAVVIGEKFEVSVYGLLCTTSTTELSIPMCREHCLITSFGIGIMADISSSQGVSSCDSHSDSDTSLQERLDDVCIQAMDWAAGKRVALSVGYLSDLMAVADSRESDKWDSKDCFSMVVINLLLLEDSMDSSSSSSVNGNSPQSTHSTILCHSTLTNATLLLTSKPPRGSSVSKKMYATSDLALKIPWTPDCTLVADVVDDKVVLQVTARTGVPPVSQALRVMAEIGRRWSTCIRDVLRQLLSRSETIWMSQNGFNKIKVQGLHVSLSMYVSAGSSVAASATTASEGGSLTPEPEEQEQFLLQGSEYLGDAWISLSSLRRDEQAVAQESEDDGMDILVSESQGDGAGTGTKGSANLYKMWRKPTDVDEIASHYDRESRHVCPLSCLDYRFLTAKDEWCSSRQGLAYTAFGQRLLDASIEEHFEALEHARLALHAAIATARPMIEFFWRLCKGCAETIFKPVSESLARTGDGNGDANCRLFADYYRIWCASCVTVAVRRMSGKSEVCYFDINYSESKGILKVAARAPAQYKTILNSFELKAKEQMTTTIRSLLLSAVNTSDSKYDIYDH